MYVIDRRTLTMELPPRARRIRKIFWPAGGKLRTTSACAENTPIQLDSSISAWNYLRVRGEYFPNCHPRYGGQELPPRARRIHGGTNRINPWRGTTSACAENTLRPPGHRLCTGNYLRVRGEYVYELSNHCMISELPPRARRILFFPDALLAAVGTTSACAENTFLPRRTLSSSGNYLRVRGEYPPVFTPGAFFMELPPRARRILLAQLLLKIHVGTTSACAENTGTPRKLL